MFSQRVVFGRPPIFDEIVAAFPGACMPGVYFSWGDKIYSPSGVRLGRALMVHEAVHGERQGHEIINWWRRYIADTKFRLAEEIPAHRAEFAFVAANVADRNIRRRALTLIAMRLSGPLYGHMIPLRKAKEIVRSAA